eukprot:833617_1
MESHIYFALTMFLVFHVSLCAEKGVVTIGEEVSSRSSANSQNISQIYVSRIKDGKQSGTAEYAFVAGIGNGKTGWVIYRYNGKFKIIVPTNEQSFDANLVVNV